MSATCNPKSASPALLGCPLPVMAAAWRCTATARAGDRCWKLAGARRHCRRRAAACAPLVLVGARQAGSACHVLHYALQVPPLCCCRPVSEHPYLPIPSPARSSSRWHATASVAAPAARGRSQQQPCRSSRGGSSRTLRPPLRWQSRRWTIGWPCSMREWGAVAFAGRGCVHGAAGRGWAR